MEKFCYFLFMHSKNDKISPLQNLPRQIFPVEMTHAAIFRCLLRKNGLPKISRSDEIKIVASCLQSIQKGKILFAASLQVEKSTFDVPSQSISLSIATWSEADALTRGADFCQTQ